MRDGDGDVATTCVIHELSVGALERWSVCCKVRYLRSIP